MSIGVATQSVIFYILSCSECTKITTRYKAKKQAKKDRHEKEQLEMQQPGLYRHPSPFATNQYWIEDIKLGPHGAKSKKDKVCVNNESQNALNTSARTESSYAGSTAQGTDPPSSPTAVTDSSRLSGDGWNLKRYQREDEALWGIDFHGPGQKIKDAITKAGNTATKFVESRLSRSGDATIEEAPETTSSYFAARNPPVNELHPPIVSTPSSRDETRWMLQPPPSAKIMEGKERVIRSRADSTGSSRSRRPAEEPLSRQVTGKLVDAKLQSGQMFPDRPQPVSRTNTNTSARPGLRHAERQRSPSPNSSDSSTEMRARTRRKQSSAKMISKSYAGESDDSLDSPYQVTTMPRARVTSRRTSVRSKASGSLTKLENSQVPQRSRSSTLNGISSTPTTLTVDVREETDDTTKATSNGQTQTQSKDIL